MPQRGNQNALPAAAAPGRDSLPPGEADDLTDLIAEEVGFHCWLVTPLPPGVPEYWLWPGGSGSPQRIRRLWLQ